EVAMPDAYPRSRRNARTSLVVVRAVVVPDAVARVRRGVARAPHPLAAVPLPLAGDPDVARDRIVVLDDDPRAHADVIVAVADHRPRVRARDAAVEDVAAVVHVHPVARDGAAIVAMPHHGAAIAVPH